MKNIAEEVIQILKGRFKIENNMIATVDQLANAVKDGKHLDLNRLVELGKSNDKSDNFKMVEDVSGIMNNIDFETHEVKGYEPHCGWSKEN